MKLQFEPEKNEWDLPEEELQLVLTQAITKLETQKTLQQQNKRFAITALFVSASVIGATCTLIFGQFFPILIGAIMYWHAYELAKTYVEGKH